MTITTLRPVGPEISGIVDAHTLSARRSSLEGQVLGVVWNRLGHSDWFFDALVAELADADALVGVVRVTKPSQSVAPSTIDWDRLMSATAGISGFGGCGSCSARSMRDAIELDWAGVPSVWVGHRSLAPSARAIAKLAGHPDYPMVFADYPYAPTASWTEDEAIALARELPPAVRNALTAVEA